MPGDSTWWAKRLQPGAIYPTGNTVDWTWTSTGTGGVEWTPPMFPVDITDIEITETHVVFKRHFMIVATIPLALVRKILGVGLLDAFKADP